MATPFLNTNPNVTSQAKFNLFDFTPKASLNVPQSIKTAQTIQTTPQASFNVPKSIQVAKTITPQAPISGVVRIGTQTQAGYDEEKIQRFIQRGKDLGKSKEDIRNAYEKAKNDGLFDLQEQNQIQPTQPQEQGFLESIKYKPYTPEEVTAFDPNKSTAQNLIEGQGRYAKNIIGGVYNILPGIAQLGTGIATGVTKDMYNKIGGLFGMDTTEYEKGQVEKTNALITGIAKDYVNKYGNSEGFKKALMEDPTAIVSDVLTVAGIGFAGKAKLNTVQKTALEAEKANIINQVKNATTLEQKSALIKQGIAKSKQIAEKTKQVETATAGMKTAFKYDPYVAVPSLTIKGTVKTLEGGVEGLNTIGKNIEQGGEKFRNIISGLDEKEINALKETSTEEFKNILNQAKEAKSNDYVQTPYNEGAKKANEAFKTLEDNLSINQTKRVDELKNSGITKIDTGKVREEIVADLEKTFNVKGVNIKDGKLEYKTTTGRESLLDETNPKDLEAIKLLEKVTRSKTPLEMMDNIKKMQNLIYDSNILNRTSKDMYNLIKRSIGKLNQSFKEQVGGNYGKILDDMSTDIQLKKQLDKIFKASSGEEVLNRGELAMKRLANGTTTSAEARQLAILIKEKTGIDLIKEARLRQLAMDLVGDKRGATLFGAIEKGPKGIIDYGLGKLKDISPFSKEKTALARTNKLLSNKKKNANTSNTNNFTSNTTNKQTNNKSTSNNSMALIGNNNKLLKAPTKALQTSKQTQKLLIKQGKLVSKDLQTNLSKLTKDNQRFGSEVAKQIGLPEDEIKLLKRVEEAMVKLSKEEGRWIKPEDAAIYVDLGDMNKGIKGTFEKWEDIFNSLRNKEIRYIQKNNPEMGILTEPTNPVKSNIQTNLSKLTTSNIDEIASKITTDSTKLAKVKQVIKQHLIKYGEQFKDYMSELVDKIAEVTGTKLNLLGKEGIGVEKTKLLKKSVDKVSDDLISEAKKYKSFDEFKQAIYNDYYNKKRKLKELTYEKLDKQFIKFKENHPGYTNSEDFQKLRISLDDPNYELSDIERKINNTNNGNTKVRNSNIDKDILKKEELKFLNKQKEILKNYIDNINNLEKNDLEKQLTNKYPLLSDKFKKENKGYSIYDVGSANNLIKYIEEVKPKIDSNLLKKIDKNDYDILYDIYKAEEYNKSTIKGLGYGESTNYKFYNLKDKYIETALKKIINRKPKNINFSWSGKYYKDFVIYIDIGGRQISFHGVSMDRILPNGFDDMNKIPIGEWIGRKANFNPLTLSNKEYKEYFNSQQLKQIYEQANKPKLLK